MHLVVLNFMCLNVEKFVKIQSINQIELIDMRKKNGSIQCLPGLTGLAQVNSYDGMSVKEKAAFDGKYAHSISFIIDAKIFYRTFSYLFRTPPVY